MEKTDTRPPFAASDGIIPPEFRKIKTPCYVLDETALIKNAELMGKIAEKTGCKMLLAQKAFSNYDCYHLLEPYLAGTEASGLYEVNHKPDTPDESTMSIHHPLFGRLSYRW